MESKEFPSPCRGLIFFTFTTYDGYTIETVSVPLQGTYLLYKPKFLIFRKRLESFRPLAGDLSSLREASASRNHNNSFRPLAGDLSSLRYHMSTTIYIFIVSVPLQGTYLLYRGNVVFERVIMVSVPLQGTYLLYRLGGVVMVELISFPSPYRGLIFLTRRTEI